MAASHSRPRRGSGPMRPEHFSTGGLATTGCLPGAAPRHIAEASNETRRLPTPGPHPLCLVGGSPMTRRTLWAVLLAVFLLVGGAAWYLFRPEKAFIDDVVDEPFPEEVLPGAAPAPDSSAPPERP